MLNHLPDQRVSKRLSVNVSAIYPPAHPVLLHPLRFFLVNSRGKYEFVIQWHLLWMGAYLLLPTLK
jgi:hypothetical protein